MTKRTCSIPECEKPASARGWCKMHYKRWMRHGDPNKTLRGKAKGNTCSIENCNDEVRARGWCNAHWKRWARHGDPLAGNSKRYNSPEEAFAAYATPVDSGCIEWTGTLDRHGYGEISINNTSRRAHRYAWERKKGKVPSELVIDHMCHNPPCVNVEHLRVVTRSENQENRKGATAASTSGIRNVHWHKREEKWFVQVKAKGITYYGNYHDSLKDAEQQAIKMREELHIRNPLAK